MATDDYAYGPSTTGVLAIGQSRLGSIEEASDQDSLAVTLKAGREYAFNLNTTFDPGTPGGGSISLQDSTGTTLVSENVVTVVGAGCTYRPTVDGTYYLTVSGTNSGGDAFTGTYAVSARERSDDHAEGIGTRELMGGTDRFGTSKFGTIETAGDRDSFQPTDQVSYDLQAGTSYVFEVHGAADCYAPLLSPTVQLINASTGAVVAADANTDGGRTASISFQVVNTDPYYLTVGGLGSTVGTYVVGMRDGDDDFGGGSATNGVLAVGGSASGHLDWNYDRTFSEEDSFAVALQAGRTYSFAFKTGAPVWGGLSLSDGNGAVAAYVDGPVHPETSFSFRPRVDGTYYLTVRAVDGYPPYSFNYGVTATEVPVGPNAPPELDTPEGALTPAELSVDSSDGAQIQFAGDHDSTRVKLQAGHDYIFVVRGAATGQGSLWSPTLKVVDASTGSVVAGDDNADGRRNCKVTFHALADGVYYVTEGAVGTDIGTYTVSVRDAIDDFAYGVGTEGVLAIGETVSGGLQRTVEDTGDADNFRMVLQAGHEYEFSMQGSNDAALANRVPFSLTRRWPISSPH